MESNASSDVGRFEKPIDTSLPSCPDPKEEELDETATSVMSTHEFSLDQFMMQRDLVIGGLTDHDVALRYCSRLLVSSFLLTGSPKQLISDKLCRVSVKSLALTCLGNILKFYPEIFKDTLAKSPSKHEEKQMISDVLLFADHSDPQIRGNLGMLIGYFLQGMLASNKTFFEEENPKDNITMENLTKLILKVLLYIFFFIINYYNTTVEFHFSGSRR